MTPVFLSRPQPTNPNQPTTEQAMATTFPGSPTQERIFGIKFRPHTLLGKCLWVLVGFAAAINIVPYVISANIILARALGSISLPFPFDWLFDAIAFILPSLVGFAAWMVFQHCETREIKNKNDWTLRGLCYAIDFAVVLVAFPPLKVPLDVFWAAPSFGDIDIWSIVITAISVWGFEKVVEIGNTIAGTK